MLLEKQTRSAENVKILQDKLSFKRDNCVDILVTAHFRSLTSAVMHENDLLSFKLKRIMGCNSKVCIVRVKQSPF